MPVVSARYQLCRWLLAAALALSTPILLEYIELRTPWWLESYAPATSMCEVALLGYFINFKIPARFARYSQSPCRCRDCVAKLPRMIRRAPRAFVCVAMFLATTVGLRRIAHIVYRNQPAELSDRELLMARTVLHVALCHAVLRQTDDFRSFHFGDERKTGIWSKDRRMPVVPPPNSVRNVGLVLLGVLVGGFFHLLPQTIALVWFGGTFKGVNSGVIFPVYLLLSWPELGMLPRLAARPFYDWMEEVSGKEWRDVKIQEGTWMDFFSMMSQIK